MKFNLQQIIEGVSNTKGKDFFNSITLQLANAIGADYTFIAKLDLNKYTSKTIALAAQGSIVDNIEYSLDYTPCANVADNSICCYPFDVVKAFPKDQLLIDMKIEGYLGIPLKDNDGKVMGLIVALYEKSVEDEEDIKTLFQIFSGRIEAEIDRIEYEETILELNTNLERKVKQRTQALESAQEKLVESEKLASLGNLVAGVAHEINTPLGISLTAYSILEEKYAEFNQKLSDKHLSIEDMTAFCHTIEDCFPLIKSNLERAANLVENFKKTASDQHHFDLETINLKQYYQQVATTLNPILNKNSIQLHIDISDQISINTYPGVHAQILTNLVNNSVMHGFTENQEQKDIFITSDIFEKNKICLHYHDNGQGVSDEVATNIFEPFFTTARSKGGTGLGMSILHNLVTQKLSGEINIDKQQHGFNLDISF